VRGCVWLWHLLLTEAVASRAAETAACATGSISSCQLLSAWCCRMLQQPSLTSSVWLFTSASGVSIAVLVVEAANNRVCWSLSCSCYMCSGALAVPSAVGCCLISRQLCKPALRRLVSQDMLAAAAWFPLSAVALAAA
jgi:hypothetical protein